MRRYHDALRAAVLVGVLSATPHRAAAQHPREGAIATLGIGSRTFVVGYGPDGFVSLVIGDYTYTSHTVARERARARERYDADSVIAWVQAVRRWVPPASDTLRRSNDEIPSSVQAPVLGAYRDAGRTLRVHLREGTPAPAGIWLGECGGADAAGGDASRADVARFLWAMERAAVAARWARGDRPAGVARDSVLDEHEVSCPARARVSNTRPEFPVAPGVSSYELLASFVVDSAGRPEPATLRTLPGSDPRFVASFEETLPIWRYVAGRRAGRRVRQRVHVAVPFRRWTSVAPATAAPVPVAPAGDGSRRIAVGPLRNDFWGGAASEEREYVFDLIGAETAARWVDSVSPYLGRDGRLPRPCYDLTCSFPLQDGEGAGITLLIDARREGGVQHHVSLDRCHGEGSPGYDITPDQARSLVAAVRRAARGAAARPARRGRAAAPRPRYQHEVACPASDFVKGRSSPQAWEFQGWKAGELVVSRFVVDTAGKVDPRSVATLPGPSREAVDSLGYLLRTVRFQPATFGGQRVPQFVHWAVPIDVTPVDPTVPQPDVDMLTDERYSWVGGSLLGSDGNPVVGAQVTLTLSVGPRGQLPLPYSATSNEGGYFVIPAVLPGEYRMQARAIGYVQPEPRIVTVNAQYSSTVELRLDRR